MIKHAYQMGNLQAMHSLGLIPNASLQQMGLMPEGQAGLTPYVPGVTEMPSPSKDGLGKFVRKVGPAAGALAGGVLGGVLSRGRNIGALKAVGEGSLAGAGFGWLPDVFATAGEHLSS